MMDRIDDPNAHEEIMLASNTHIRACASTQLYLIKERIEEEKNRRRT